MANDPQAHTRTPTRKDTSNMLRLHRLQLIPAVLGLSVLIAACGADAPDAAGATADAAGGTATGQRTVEVAMEDMKFVQPELTVQTGETIDFQFTNNGQVAHDAFVGDNAAQMGHETEMAEMGATTDHDDDEPAIVLQPGESGDLSYTFDTAGTYEVGCHQPGHYAAGMKMNVTVE